MNFSWNEPDEWLLQTIHDLPNNEYDEHQMKKRTIMKKSKNDIFRRKQENEIDIAAWYIKKIEWVYNQRRKDL